MVFQTRSIVIAGTACPTGIRLYSQSGDGDLREGCYDEEFDIPPEAQRNGWYCGEFRASGDPGGAIGCISWANKWNLVVFYQEAGGAIKERRNHDERGWYESDFVEHDAMSGTDLGRVHTANADRIMLFFQDKDGYLCYRKANNFHREPKVHIAKIATLSAITATTWTETEEVRVYCQAEDKTVVEYVGSFYDDNSWRKGDFEQTQLTIMGGMAAVSWVDERINIRLYMQNPDNSIFEWCYTDAGGWQPGFQVSPVSLPNTDIAAFVRRDDRSGLLNCYVYWAGPDKILYQRIYFPNSYDPQSGSGWTPITEVAYLASSGHWNGTTTGGPFTDLHPELDQKQIRAVHIQSGSTVNGFGVEFTDGTQGPWHGGTEGDMQHFILGNGEGIVQVQSCSDGAHIQKIRFVTNKGRVSEWFDEEGSHPTIWELDGLILAGLAGFGDNKIRGLQPLWNEQPPKTGLAVLDNMVTDAAKLQVEIEESRIVIDQQAQQVEQTSSETTTTLQGPATNAMKNVVLLAQLIVQLNSASDDKDKIKLIGQCKTVSIKANDLFEQMHTKAQNILHEATQLANDVTYQASAAETRKTRIHNMMKVAEATRVSEAQVYEMRRQRVKLAEEQIEIAQRTRQEAEEKLREAKKARIFRDVFTLGFGELGDWGNVNAAIDYAKNLIKSAESNLATCSLLAQQAEVNLGKVESELKQFDKLSQDLNALLPALDSSVKLSSETLTKTHDLENDTLDVAQFLGSLSAKSSPMFAEHAARKLANTVLAIEEVMKTGVNIRGALFQGFTDVDDKVLKTIATSPVPPSPVDDMVG